MHPDTPITELKNLGPASATQLARVQIYTYAELERKGAIASYAALLRLKDFKPNLNFLYAMLGALENKHWKEFSCHKGEILIQLESFLEIDNQF